MEFRKEPVDSKYEIGEDIGKGQFATVKRCIEKSSRGEYAAKFIRKRRGGGRRGATLEDIQREIQILTDTKHRNIINLYEVYDTQREVILILELVDGGELFEHLADRDRLDEEEASAFIKQILDGVQHLHSKQIAHLDLKPENILLQDKNSTAVKLIDFGLSRKVGPKDDQRAMMGTAEFVAPEVISFEPLCLATDMWSIGVLTYILLSGASPFLGDNQQETYHNITSVNYDFDEEYFNGTSEMAKDFIRKLLIKDTRKRANIKECLCHPWIKPVEKKQKDLRRSSRINTEHLKKFIARQRWKRSMRVVSLCNRLSRSMQLRRIQSNDTLGSNKSTEEDDDLKTSSEDETPEEMAARRITDDVIAKAIQIVSGKDVEAKEDKQAAINITETADMATATSVKDVAANEVDEVLSKGVGTFSIETNIEDLSENDNAIEREDLSASLQLHIDLPDTLDQLGNEVKEENKLAGVKPDVVEIDEESKVSATEMLEMETDRAENGVTEEEFTKADAVPSFTNEAANATDVEQSVDDIVEAVVAASENTIQQEQDCAKPLAFTERQDSVISCEDDEGFEDAEAVEVSQPTTSCVVVENEERVEESCIEIADKEIIESEDENKGIVDMGNGIDEVKRGEVHTDTDSKGSNEMLHENAIGIADAGVLNKEADTPSGVSTSLFKTSTACVSGKVVDKPMEHDQGAQDEEPVVTLRRGALAKKDRRHSSKHVRFSRELSVVIPDEALIEEPQDENNDVQEIVVRKYDPLRIRCFDPSATGEQNINEEEEDNLRFNSLLDGKPVRAMKPWPEGFKPRLVGVRPWLVGNSGPNRKRVPKRYSRGSLKKDVAKRRRRFSTSWEMEDIDIIGPVESFEMQLFEIKSE